MVGFVRWWESLGKAERIVALSIGLSAPIAIINSTVWAIAVAYISHQKALVDVERLRLAAARSSDPLHHGAFQAPVDDVGQPVTSAS